MNQEEINREANIESRKFYGEESWDSSTWATTPFEFGYRLAREKAQKEIDHCKSYYSKDNKIGPIARLEHAIEKRDRLLDEANAQFKCLKSIVEQKIIKIEADFVGRTTFSGMVNKIEEWNKQYEEIFKDAK